MKKLILFLSVLALCLSVSAKDNGADIPQYQIAGAGAGNGGNQLVSVSIIGKKADKVTESMLIKAAVHGVLFRDYSDSTHSGFGSSSSHPAMMGSPAAYSQHLDFFEPFFKDGRYSDYGQYVDDSRRVVKVGKEYKVTATVSVSAASLRKDLEKQGILKSLNSGW